MSSAQVPSDGFTIVQTDAGTSPTADRPRDTITFTSSDNSITITGNDTTDTIDFVAVGGGGGGITALTGDVTATGPGSVAATIANDAVTNTKLANMATQTFKGRTTAGTGDPEDLTATQATAILNAFVGDSGSGGTKGLVPAPSAGDSTKYLRGNGTWTTVTAGDFSGPASSTDNAVVRFDGTGGKTGQNSGVTIDDSDRFNKLHTLAGSSGSPALVVGADQAGPMNMWYNTTALSLDMRLGGSGQGTIRFLENGYNYINFYDGTGAGGVPEIKSNGRIYIRATTGVSLYHNTLSVLETYSSGPRITNTAVLLIDSSNPYFHWKHTSNPASSPDSGHSYLFFTSNRLYSKTSAGTLLGHGGTLKADTTAVGNVGSGEDNLMTYSLPASTLATNGDHLEIRMAGTFAANANNKTVKAYFGSQQLLSTGALAFNGTDWEILITVIRTGATTQKAIARFSSSDAVMTSTTDYTTPAETLSSAITIKATGEATSNDDIKQEILTVKMFPNGN